MHTPCCNQTQKTMTQRNKWAKTKKAQAIKHSLSTTQTLMFSRRPKSTAMQSAL